MARKEKQEKFIKGSPSSTGSTGKKRKYIPIKRRKKRTRQIKRTVSQQRG
jgi:hypothetical protein